LPTNLGHWGLQLELSETEMKEEITRVLTANDPRVPNNVTKYNYKERVYKVDPPGQGDLLAIHFSIDGSALHKVGPTGPQLRLRKGY
jgi:dynein intermediate chain 1, axonemal